MSRRGRAVTFSAVQSKKVNSTLSTFKNQNKPPEPEVLVDSTTKVGEEFYKRVIELENEIQLSQNPSLPLIEELIKLYEKGIVSFTEFHNRQKVQYFKNKLTKLLMGYNKLKKKESDNKKPSSWSKFMNAHKKNKNKFMLFLNVETSKKEATNILDNREKKISAGYDQITKDLEDQKKIFLERKKGKKKMNMEKKGNEIKNDNNDLENNDEVKGEKIYTSISNKLRGRNDQVDSSLNDFMKKLHYIYVHSKIFETPIEALNEILEQIFLHKINKYYYYQDQIKQFELMQKDAEKEGEEHDEGIEFLIKDLQNERKSYYMSLESLIDKIRIRIKEKCSETSNDDKNVQKYLDELMSNISKIFIK